MELAAGGTARVSQHPRAHDTRPSDHGVLHIAGRCNRCSGQQAVELCTCTGTYVDKALRKHAASTEPAWQDFGQKAGVVIWRSVDSHVKNWPKPKRGKLHKGDSCIVLNTTEGPECGKLLHDVSDSRHGLVAVHANGVEPKDYLLRDRGLWFLDVFTDRLGNNPRFLFYVHPRGLSLKDDFEKLAAALDLPSPQAALWSRGSQRPMARPPLWSQTSPSSPAAP